MSDLSTTVDVRDVLARPVPAFEEEVLGMQSEVLAYDAVARVHSGVRPARRVVDTADWTSLEDAVAAGVTLPCQLVDPDVFFADSPVEVAFAKSLCAGCPVRTLCLDTALARREPWGVWGGEWFSAGQAVGDKRPRGRPRKRRAA